MKENNDNNEISTSIRIVLSICGTVIGFLLFEYIKAFL
jgi:hypothetical protein